MLYEVDWAEDGTYRPDEYNSPEKFFNDCLENSKEFDLQLGYFSSATISVLADGFASFISNGGGYDHLWENQIEWYKWAVNGISELAGEDDSEHAMVGKVTLVNEAKKYLTEENGKEPTIKELSEYTRLSEEELEDKIGRASCRERV